MKYQETGVGQKADFADFVKKIIPELFGGRFAVEGKAVKLPADIPLEYKTKYDEGDQSGSFSLKVSWDYSTVEEADTEVNVDVD